MLLPIESGATSIVPDPTVTSAPTETAGEPSIEIADTVPADDRVATDLASATKAVRNFCTAPETASRGLDVNAQYHVILDDAVVAN